LVNKNWDGFLIEADKVAVKDIKSQRVFWKHNLKIENKFITKDNIDTIIKKINIPKKIGLLRSARIKFFNNSLNQNILQLKKILNNKILN
jgi:hypothetical protein